MESQATGKIQQARKMITVYFFASLKEQLGQSQITLDTGSNPCSIADVKQQLIEHHQHWQKALSNPLLLSAVNHQIVNEQHAVQPNDEVAFFPPVTGG